ncbi:MAG: AAA family ATPase [Actinobacteria bacterium]|nr:AAA family ATPase [Actinomycetota bacterium]
MRELVEREAGGTCLFLQGASGELAPAHQYVGDVRVAERHGRRLGYAALSALESMLPPGQRLAYAGVMESGAPLAVWKPEPFNPPTAVEAAGFDVVGTATSGQAARTLAREAGIGESRTLASLLWRLDHGRLQLSHNSVVILDEAGMTDDAELLRLLAAVELAGAKVVLVGDDRQLSSVGPGGALGALLERHADAVHVLDENVRQRDPNERLALDALRSGSVEAAVSWYGDAGRIAVCPDRDAALDAVVDGWATDVAEGRQAAMYAWRRDNVAELNQRGRAAWEALGRLSGPELVVGDTSYRAGDRVVALAPGAHGEVVTSECATVLAVDVSRRELVATMDDDGRTQRLAGVDLDAAHLAHGYALTVHRAQGATVERAHALEDGGGRELAYVKMSRAKERSTVYAVADSLDQAVEDLRWSWAQSRRIAWAIDSGTPVPHGDAPPSPEHTPEVAASVRHARLVAEREALAAAIPADPGLAYPQAEARVRTLRQELAELDRAEGRGVWRDTPVGDAAMAWSQAVGEQRRCLAVAEHARLWERHQLRRQAALAAEGELPLREAYQRLAGAERARLGAELPEAEQRLATLESQDLARLRFEIAHPEVPLRLQHLDRQITLAAYDLALERQALDGIAPEVSHLPPPHHGVERALRSPDLGIDLGL